MYNNPYNNFYRRPIYRNRLIGSGFLTPFVLGGITGGILAPTFYRPRPFYGPAPFYPPPFYY